jgi:hypothetical protein
MIAKIDEMVTERDDFERSFETVKYLRKRRKKKLFEFIIDNSSHVYFYIS